MGHIAEWLSEPMTEDVLQKIFMSDQDMYPAPLTYARLKSWVDGCPDLSRCFSIPPDTGKDTERNEVAGAIIVLPLIETAWRDLLDGTLRETDIDPSVMFPPDDSSSAVGLHVFHVERFSERLKGFATGSLKYAHDAARTKQWDVLGCSALTATEEGTRSFQRLGFVATGYEEFWVEINCQITLVPVYPGQGADLVTKSEKACIKGKAHMVARFSNDKDQASH
ncbi:hypothetical protein BKA67DRAFT_661763 [Truncatella angustata]|uniref:Uncharacterized protein n=1 Tax=Truncatella angustata TaxID=152316 RepID=A0A9P8UFD9_9PEZI|nr:uncharacterized protein BKA67DRAFT_661763 [Truncatella angustata]KAH6648813.1 hypothetical protein BKA67DRAFT_661763 [Truncatella angustata]